METTLQVWSWWTTKYNCLYKNNIILIKIVNKLLFLYAFQTIILRFTMYLWFLCINYFHWWVWHAKIPHCSFDHECRALVKKIVAPHRQWWRLHMSETFSERRKIITFKLYLLISNQLGHWIFIMPSITCHTFTLFEA